ncbi:MAG TPA: VOC family protein [Longimicrobiaceae bacterium]|jgi:predicted enzyme related to lactoylglutathione lyase|nr:VOC family protein [Longimicrobiaceae bacterium]
MPRPVHFEISADDPERLASFYSGVFGWSVQKWEGPQDYWLIKTGETGTPGIDGGMTRRNPGPAGTVNTIDVPSVDEFVEKVTSAGGTVALPKMAVPGVGWLAYCVDPEGTLFGMMQADPSAK